MIYQKDYFINNSKATIIIAHGIAEHSGRYEKIALTLNQNGYDVITYDHLGHGKSLGARGKIRSFHDHIDVLNMIVKKEKTRNNNKKIFLLGHSMGGEVVNLYAVKYGDVDGIISSSAATKTPSNAKILRVIGFWYLRWVPINTKIFDKFLAKDPKVLEKNKKDELMLSKMYISLIGEMFVKGIKYLNKNVSKFKTPVLYIHGTSDGIVDVSASKEIIEKISSTDKTLKIYEDEYHEMLNDYNGEKILIDIIEWVNDRV
ncbi:alpha/beta hydrolase [Haploplasma axanthum]|nr:alpha/beta hydrolase [Haploplasma axanthum]